MTRLALASRALNVAHALILAAILGTGLAHVAVANWTAATCAAPC